MTDGSSGALGDSLPDPVLNQPIGPPLPIMWAAHTTEEQRNRLANLDAWVAWLAERYSLDRRTVPKCWSNHWELIEELSALHLAWEAAYATTSHADAPLAWHERFERARARLADWVARSGCGGGGHRARQQATGAAAG